MLYYYKMVYKKVEYVECIRQYFSSNNKRLTNITKLKIKDLIEIVEKHKIDIDTFVKERNEAIEKEAKEIEERNEKYERDRLERQQRERENEMYLYKLKEENIIPLNVIENKFIMLENLKDTYKYNQKKYYYEKIEKENEEIAQNFQKRLGGVLNGNILNINGMNVSFNSLGEYKPRTTEHIRRMYNEYNYIYMLRDLKVIDYLYNQLKDEKKEIILSKLNEVLSLVNKDYDMLHLYITLLQKQNGDL